MTPVQTVLDRNISAPQTAANRLPAANGHPFRRRRQRNQCPRGPAGREFGIVGQGCGYQLCDRTGRCRCVRSAATLLRVQLAQQHAAAGKERNQGPEPSQAPAERPAFWTRPPTVPVVLVPLGIDIERCREHCGILRWPTSTTVFVVQARSSDRILSGNMKCFSAQRVAVLS